MLPVMRSLIGRWTRAVVAEGLPVDGGVKGLLEGWTVGLVEGGVEGTVRVLRHVMDVGTAGDLNHLVVVGVHLLASLSTSENVNY